MTPNNVLVLLFDDLARSIRAAANTPNLDRLEAYGRLFPNAWVGATCSQARAMLVSGLYPHREKNRVFGLFSGEGSGTNALPTDNPAALGWAAWDSTWRGKWHLADPALALSGHTSALGWASFDGSWQNLHVGGGGYDHWLRTFAGETGQGQDWTDVYATDYVADAVISDLYAQRRLVVAAWNAIHKPLHFPPGYVGGENTDTAKRIAMLEYLDARLGDVLPVAFSQGYQVVACTDNGGTHDEGGKGNVSQLAISADVVLAGSTVAGRGSSSALLTLTDLHATIWHWLTGMPPSETDGITLIGQTVGRTVAFADAGHGTDGALPDTWDRAVRDARYKLVAFDWDHATLGGATFAWALFDLWTDPDELTDLSENPDFAAIRATLEAALVASFVNPPAGGLIFRPETVPGPSAPR